MDWSDRLPGAGPPAAEVEGLAGLLGCPALGKTRATLDLQQLENGRGAPGAVRGAPPQGRAVLRAGEQAEWQR